MTSRPIGVRTRHAVHAVLLTLAALLVLLLPGPAVADASVTSGVTSGVTSTDTASVTVTLDTVSPEVLTFGDDLTVQATLRNDTSTPVTDPVVRLGIDRDSDSHTRSWVADWDTTDPDAPSGREVETTTEDTLAPGDSATVKFTVTWASLGLGTWTSWGPQGISVLVVDDGVTVAAARTFVVWDPTDGTRDAAPVRTAVLAPVTGPPVDADAVTASDDLTRAVTTGGRLAHVLEATGSTDIAWAVDPELVEAAASSTDTAVSAWATELVTRSESRVAFALDAFDPDVAAFAHSGVTIPSLEVTGPLAEWRHDLAWPVGPPDATTTRAVAEAGAALVVADGGALAPARSVGRTLSGITTLPTASGDLTALVADDALSTVLASDDRSELVVQRRMVAETAAISVENPTSPPTLLLTLPRTWDPDPTTFAGRLDVLDSTGWSRTVGLDQLLDTDPTTADRADLKKRTVDDDELAPEVVRSLSTARADLAEIATIVPDPQALTGDIDPALVAPSSVAFRDDPVARSLAVQSAQTAVATMTSAVSVTKGSNITFIAQSGDLPVAISNGLPQAITVRVVLVPDSPRLQVSDSPVVTIPAGSEQRVPVPVKAVGSGDVSVAVQVVGEDGVEVTAPSSFVVTVRADWESVGSAVIFTVLGLLVVGGLWRTVRRGRASTRTRALTPEEHDLDVAAGAVPPDDATPHDDPDRDAGASR